MSVAGKLKPCPICGVKPDYQDPEYEEIFFSARQTPSLFCDCGVEMREHPNTHMCGDVYQDDIDRAISNLIARWNKYCEKIITTISKPEELNK